MTFVSRRTRVTLLLALPVWLAIFDGGLDVVHAEEDEDLDTAPPPDEDLDTAPSPVDENAPVNGGDCPRECCFRFDGPVVPQFEYPAAQPNSIGDHTLNVNNSLVNTDGSFISGCNGFMSEYYDETLGMWTSNWTGSDNVTRDLIDIFYATGDTLFNVRTIQTFMDPDLRETLSNRLIRTNLSCSNGQFQVDSCVQFTIDGEGSNFTCNYVEAGAMCLPEVEDRGGDETLFQDAGAIAGGTIAGAVVVGGLALCFVKSRKRRISEKGPLSSDDLEFEENNKKRNGAPAPPREGVKTLLQRIQKDGTLTVPPAGSRAPLGQSPSPESRSASVGPQESASPSMYPNLKKKPDDPVLYKSPTDTSSIETASVVDDQFV